MLALVADVGYSHLHSRRRVRIFVGVEHVLRVLSGKKIVRGQHVEKETPNAENVRLSSKRLTLQDLWCYVSRSTAFELDLLFIVSLASQTQVRYADLQVGLVHEEDVIWLNVPVDDILAVHKIYGEQHLSHDRPDLLLCKLLFFLKMLQYGAILRKLHDQTHRHCLVYFLEVH